MRFSLSCLIVTAVLLVSGTFAAPTSDVSAVEFDKRTPQSFGRGGPDRDSYYRGCRRRWSRDSDRNRCYRGWDDCNRRYSRSNDRYGCYRSYGSFFKRDAVSSGASDSTVQQTTAQQFGPEHGDVQQTISQQGETYQQGLSRVAAAESQERERQTALLNLQAAANHQAGSQSSQQQAVETNVKRQQSSSQIAGEPVQQAGGPVSDFPAQSSVQTVGTPEQEALQRFQAQQAALSAQQFATLGAMQDQINANMAGTVSARDEQDLEARGRRHRKHKHHKHKGYKKHG